MGGIYIKGMEMPVFEHQSWDIRKDVYGKWYMVDTNAETSDGEWHEIVPVPAHGRLIDADAMERLMCDTVQGDIRGYPYSDTLWDTAFRWLDHQPTIIPAEEDNNG